METNAAQRKANMTEKIPELRETIVMVEQLQKQVCLAFCLSTPKEILRS